MMIGRVVVMESRALTIAVKGLRNVRSDFTKVPLFYTRFASEGYLSVRLRVENVTIYSDF